MAKFLKSFFQPSEKRKSGRYDGDGDDDKNEISQTMCDRRKLSISRSGRLRQANKKRHSLSLELYGENIETVEKPKSMEYHVHSPVSPEPVADKRQRRRSADDNTSEDYVPNSNDTAFVNTTSVSHSDNNKRRISAGPKSPEEEIDSAFEIIDKS